MATVQDEAPIGMWMKVKPEIGGTENKGEAGGADYEAERGADGWCRT